MHEPNHIETNEGGGADFSAIVTGNFKAENGQSVSTLDMYFDYPDDYPAKPAAVGFDNPQNFPSGGQTLQTTQYVFVERS